MADYTHTIDRWGEANRPEPDRADCRRQRLSGRGRNLPRCGEPMARSQDHAAQPGAGDRAKLGGLIYLAVRECVLLGHSVELSLDHERRGVQRRFLSRARGREHVVNQPLNGVEGRMHDHCYLPLPGRQSGSHHRNDYARIFEQVQVATHPILGVC